VIYQQVINQVKEPAVVRAALIGCGRFGAAVVTQGRLVPRLELKVVCDIDVEAAKAAFHLAGVQDGDIAVCDTAERALWAMEAGKWVIVEDAMNLMSLPLHVIVTATMVPEAGARYAYEAIRHGKHVVMVDKEADSVCGPILKHLADRAGVVYTAEDGDQPGLTMGLVSWAQMLGLEVIGGGYLHEVIYDPVSGKLRYSLGRELELTVPEEDRWAMGHIQEGEVPRYMGVRDRLSAQWQHLEECPGNMCHLVAIANGTGLMPEVPSSHLPMARITELPSVLCPRAEGGTLETRNALALPSILRSGEAPQAGMGAFIVATTADRHARETLSRCLESSWSKSAFLVYRPHHMLGVEAATSILVAGLLRAPTGSDTVLPRLDVQIQTTRDLRKGGTISTPGELAYCPDVRATLIPSVPVADDHPMPAYMSEGNRLATDVPKGTVITRRMIVPPHDSVMWCLRRKQDELFLSGDSADRQARRAL
jgi:predicted homoserine dehydrogenase-like protein